MLSVLSVATLEELSSWCLEAQVGEEKSFSVTDDIDQVAASRFAYAINERREKGHVWVNVEGTGFIPDAVTNIHIHCTD